MADEGPNHMVLAAVDEFVQQLRRRQVVGSTATAKRTAMILRVLVTKSRRSSPQGLLQDVLTTGMQMQAAKPLGAKLTGFHYRGTSHARILVDRSV